MLQHIGLKQYRSIIAPVCTCALHHTSRMLGPPLTSCVLLQYTESLIVEHGYTRGEINATTFHLEVRLPSMAFLSMLIVLSWGLFKVF